MTLGRLLTMFRHYKNDYDFKLSGRKYCELEEMMEHDGEFLPN